MQEARQMKATAGRLWSWARQHAVKMRRCKDILAAIRLLACDLLALSYQAEFPPSSHLSMGARDYDLQMKMFISAGQTAADALASGPDSVFHSVTSRSSLLKDVDVDHLYTIASESLQTMKMKGQECAPEVEWMIYQARAQHAWQERRYETAFDMYNKAYEEVFRPHASDMQSQVAGVSRDVFDKGVQLQDDSNDAEGGANHAIKWLQLVSRHTLRAMTTRGRFLAHFTCAHVLHLRLSECSYLRIESESSEVREQTIEGLLLAGDDSSAEQ
jgi:ribosomal protein L17